MATHNLTFSTACEGMILEKRADGKSAHTISDYRVTFKKMHLFLGDDPPLASITRERLVEFFAWLRDDYVSEPGGVAPRGQVKLSDKTRLNVHTNLSALWSWATANGYVERNIVRTISAPRASDPVIEPFTHDEFEALVKACDKTQSWRTRSSIASSRTTAERDRLILRLLLDTGVRAQELCDITIENVNINGNSIKVRGKGNKERTVRFGRRTAKALWAYLTPRLKEMRPTDPLILVGYPADPRPMTRHALGLLLRRIGARANVTNVHPHRFRHTFATTYLRNGGNLLTLKELLGHSDFEMVMRYAHLVQTDFAADHAKASPVDNWRV